MLVIVSALAVRHRPVAHFSQGQYARHAPQTTVSSVPAFTGRQAMNKAKKASQISRSRMITIHAKIVLDRPSVPHFRGFEPDNLIGWAAGGSRFQRPLRPKSPPKSLEPVSAHRPDRLGS